MTPPPRTLNELLPGPSMVNTNNKDIAANTLQQPKQPTQVHPNLKQSRRAPLLPTPPAPTRQHRNSTFPRPSQFQSNRFHQQHLPRPFYHQQPPLLPSLPHQIPTLPGPYQHTPGHLILQVYIYLPILLLYPSHPITPVQYTYAA